MSIGRITWKTAFGASVAIHAFLVGIVALFCMNNEPKGGEGLLTVEIGGPAGEAGGFGEEVKAGRQGNAGAGGDGAQNHAKERRLEKIDTPEEKAVPKTEGENLPEPPQAAKAVEEPDIEPPKDDTPVVAPVKEPLHETGEVKVKEVKEQPPKAEEKPKPAEKQQVKKPVKKPTPKPKQTEKTAPVKGQAQAPERDKAVKSDTDGTDGQAKKVNVGSGGAVGASGTATGTSQDEGSGVGTGIGEAFGSGQFIANGDGTYTALGSGGISYKIIHEETPPYPREARSIGYNRVVKVRVRFLVGLDGRVESTEILTKNVPNLGFTEAALSAIKEMRFEPIYHKGVNIKMYFRKTIIFQP